MGIDEVIERMTVLAEELRKDSDGRLAFHNTYLRTTEAVARALRDGFFADPEWVDRWDVAFARLYLDALDADRRGEPVPEPWAVAFRAAAAQPDLPAVRHVLLGMNAHINYDLPQALLAVISDAEFGDPEVRARREADHRRIDEVLSIRVGAEDAELQQTEPATTWQDRVLQPLNRIATRRFLRESREKVWANARELSKARAAGADSYARRLAELEKLAGARVADLERPGPVLLRLAAQGFGVRLAGEGQGPAYEGKRSANGGRAAATARPASVLWSFDPVKIGNLETTLWVSYYRRQWARFLVTSLLVVRDTFGMDWLRTIHGAWLVLRANQLWAPNPGDPDGARRCMARFYALLLLTHGVPAGPARAARLEVDWWAAHREHQYEEGSDDGPLVTALARLYAYVYETHEEAVRPAAQHRARAMDISDRWVAEGRHPGSPLIASERAELVRCYAALLAAVHR
ncbi:MAG TPA: DUF5995 family protein [Streptosporangiaceae bacterium]|nr:DUF5995 family protein [Streptosporangiaceae bacterium]